jgi:hypothetical protein
MSRMVHASRTNAGACYRRCPSRTLSRLISKKRMPTETNSNTLIHRGTRAMNHRAAVTPYLEPRGVQEHGGGTSQVQQLKTSDAGNAMVGDHGRVSE